MFLKHLHLKSMALIRLSVIGLCFWALGLSVRFPSFDLQMNLALPNTNLKVCSGSSGFLSMVTLIFIFTVAALGTQEHPRLSLGSNTSQFIALRFASNC